MKQFEILPKPSGRGRVYNSWPNWPDILRTSTSHIEGCTRRWCVNTKKITGIGTRVDQLHCIEVEWIDGPGGFKMREKPGTEFSMKVDIVLLSMGFLHVLHDGVVNQFGLGLDKRGNIKIDDKCMTNRPGVFAAGDAVMGASLVARAINSGRIAAEQIDYYLKSK